jgi:hypothetical protein
VTTTSEILQHLNNGVERVTTHPAIPPWCKELVFGKFVLIKTLIQSALWLTSAAAAVSAASSAACVQRQNLTLLLPAPQPAAAIVLHCQQCSPQLPQWHRSAHNRKLKQTYRSL